MTKWDGIAEFLAVAAASSFTGGARALGMSSTHVSRSIMVLEQRLGAQLFNRTTRSVRLTDTGRIFLEHCERIAQLTDEALALIGETGEPQGELRVTCSTALGERFVAPLIRRFAMRHPRLSVSITLTNRVVDLIAEGFDLGIRTGKVSDARLIGTRVASRRLYTCAAPSYLARAGRPATIEALQHHECLIGTSPAWHFKVNEQPTVHHANGRFRCNSGHAVIEACIAGLGVCQLPDFYILPFVRDGMIEIVLADFEPDEEPIWAVYPQRRHLMPKIKLVLEDLERAFAIALSAFPI